MEFTLRVPNNSREQNNNTECQHPSKPIIVQSKRNEQGCIEWEISSKKINEHIQLLRT